MRRYLLIVGLLLLMAAGAGCVVISAEKMRSGRPAAGESRNATMHEIDAVGRQKV